MNFFNEIINFIKEKSKQKQEYLLKKQENEKEIRLKELDINSKLEYSDYNKTFSKKLYNICFNIISIFVLIIITIGLLRNVIIYFTINNILLFIFLFFSYIILAVIIITRNYISQYSIFKWILSIIFLSFIFTLPSINNLILLFISNIVGNTTPEQIQKYLLIIKK